MERGYGSSGDVQRIEENGVAAGALADAVSEKAKTRQRQEMGTLGSGNQPTISKCKEVIEMAGEAAATAFGLRKGEIVVSIRCGLPSTVHLPIGRSSRT